MGRVFITYNPGELETVEALSKALREYGHQVWFDRSFSGGADWWETSYKRIAACDILVYVLSSRMGQCDYCQATLTETRRWQTPIVVVTKDASTPIPAAIQAKPVVTLSSKTAQRGYERLHQLIEEQIQLHPSRSVMPLWEEPTPIPKVKPPRNRSDSAGDPPDKLVLVAFGGIALFFLGLIILARVLQTASFSPSDVAAQPTESAHSAPVAASATWTAQVLPTASNTPMPATFDIMAAATEIPPTRLTEESPADAQTTVAPRRFADLFTTDAPDSGGTRIPTATLAPGDQPHFAVVGEENDATYQLSEAQTASDQPGQGSRIHSNNSTLRIRLSNGTVLVLLPQSELTLNQVSAPNSVVVTLWAGEVFVDNNPPTFTTVIAPTVNLEMHTHQGQMAVSVSPIIMLQCFQGECETGLCGMETTRNLTAGEHLILSDVTETVLASRPALLFTQEQIDQYDAACQGCLSGAQSPMTSTAIASDNLTPVSVTPTG